MKKTAVVLTSILIVACSTTPKPAPSPAPQAKENNTSPVSNATTAVVPPVETELHKLDAEIQALQQQSVYFDFDKSAVKPEYQGVLQKQADFVKAHGNDVITVEGNCDERGSAEYNLALGGQRADAVRKDLELLGVPATQIKTVSFGLEKPRLTCHEEKCWKENRRDDFAHKLD